MWDSLNTRRREIVKLLLNRREFVSPNSIAREMQASRRTIYYDIEKINEWLRENNIPELEMAREKGVYLSEVSCQKISELIGEEQGKKNYIFSPEERVKCIICYLAYAPENIFIEQLSECFDISRNTIFSDLKIVSKNLEGYDLSLEYHSRTGYYIDGDPIRIRAVFALYINEMAELFQKDIVKFFHMNEVEQYYGKLKKIASDLHVDYVQDTLFTVAALIPVCYNPKHHVRFLDLKVNHIQATGEFERVSFYFEDLPLEERIYLALHMLGARTNIVPDNYFEERSNIDIHSLAKALIDEFERVACIRFADREYLEHALYLHLGTSMYRYRYGIQIGNILADEIIDQYGTLFSITKIAARVLEAALECPIPDSEIAYLTLHFGAAIKPQEVPENKLKVLIVCVNGMSTSNMLRREVHKLIPFAEIVGVRAAVDLLNVQDECNLIISTIRLNSLVPVITVHPILTEFDKNCILNHPLVTRRSIAVQRDELFELVKKYVDPSNYKNLRRDLEAYLQSEKNRPESSDKDENGILSLLDLSRIRIYDHFEDWKECIRAVGQPLLESQSIEPRYTETIIEQLEQFGTYMFLTDDVILAHAKPEDGVNRLDMDMLILHRPVQFSETRYARVVLLLAAEDQEKHLGVLQDVIKLVGNENFIERMTACTNAAQVMQEIRTMLLSEE